MSTLRWSEAVSMRNEPDLSVWRAYDGEGIDPVGYVEGPTDGQPEGGGIVYAARAWPTGRLLGLGVTLADAQAALVLALGE